MYFYVDLNNHRFIFSVDKKGKDIKCLFNQQFFNSWFPEASIRLSENKKHCFISYNKNKKMNFISHNKNGKYKIHKLTSDWSVQRTQDYKKSQSYLIDECSLSYLTKNIGKFYNLELEFECECESGCEGNCKLTAFSQEAFINGVDWEEIGYTFVLSEPFMVKYRDHLNWLTICETQRMSEGFIRAHKDLVYWYDIFQYQNLSKKFIKEFLPIVNTKWISY
jgi:hypothetical protein